MVRVAGSLCCALLVAAIASASAENEVGFTGAPLTGGNSDEPISIKSDELEAEMAEGKKMFIFKRNVRVVQGNMVLKTDELEAFYPKGSNDPDRLVARGNVVMRQEDKRLFCDEAVYDRTADQLICTGRARMISGADRLSGDKIEFGIESGTVKVFGKVKVDVTPRSEEESADAGEPAAAPDPAAAPEGDG